MTTAMVAGLVERRRLTTRLDQLARAGDGPDVLLVSAPPGFGKSTLVRSWLSDGGADGASVALIELRHVGAGRRGWWRALVDALAAAVDPGTRTALASLAVPDRSGHDSFLVDLLDVLASTPVVVVVDDVQVLRSAAVLHEVDQFIRRAPRTVAIALLSRTWPPLPSLHDLRLEGRLDQIRAPDLAFNAAELATCCPDLGVAQLARVSARTEGWPAMVRLMQLGADGDFDEVELWGDDATLAGHLFDEVFSRQRPEVQDVLLMSAIADPAPLDLVVELSGRDDVGATLHEAARRSGLVRAVPQQDDAPAFHLHPILRAYLGGEQRRRDSRRFQHAHERAAAWFVRRGEHLAAVHHATATSSARVLEETFAAVGLAVVHQGSSEPLLEELGSRLTRGTPTPWVAVVGALALAENGRDAEAGVLLRSVRAGDDHDLVVARSAAEALLARRDGRPRQASAPPDEVDAARADVELGFCLHRGAQLLRAGELDCAEELLRRAVQLAEGLDREAALVDASIFLAGVSAARADVRTLAPRVDRARALAVATGWWGSTRSTYLHLLSGWVAHQQLDDVAARAHAERAEELLDPDDDPTLVQVVRSFAYGTAEGAEARDTRWLHEAWQDSDECRLAPDFVAHAAVLDAAVSTQTRRTDRIRVVVEGLLDRFGDCAEAELASVYLRLARGQGQQALADLDPVLRGDVVPVFPLTRIDAHLLAARLAAENDVPFRALEELRHALDLADELDVPRALLTMGRPGLDLLIAHQGAWGPREALVQRVLAYAALPTVAPSVALTDRELDVLRELPTLRTVEEIAGDMVVSVNTLKTHLRSIYRKLDVTSRRAAVSEARRCGLV